MSTLDATAPSATQGEASLVSLPWIKQLVSMDTTSRVPNLGLIETVRDALAAKGIASTITHDPREGWANLFATVPRTTARRTAASCCRGIPTSCRSTASNGTATRSRRKSATAACTAAAPAT